MSLTDDLVKWITGDMDPVERRVLRKAGILIIWRFGFVLFVVFSMGWLSSIGLSGFARASEIDDKISKAVNPLSASVAQLAVAVKDQATAATEQTLQLLRVAIVDAQVKKCRAPKAETAEIYRRQVLEAQGRYWKLTGQNYPAPSCADL